MGDLENSLTFYLFARPSFIEGLARILDTSSSLQAYNYSKTNTEADTKALSTDWRMVGEDFKAAIKEYDQTQEGPEAA